jgi:hypothetical protein
MTGKAFQSAHFVSATQPPSNPCHAGNTDAANTVGFAQSIYAA